MPKDMSLTVEPVSTLMDEECSITCSNLGMCRTVTVISVILNDEDGIVFYSSAEFISDSDGHLNVDKSFSYRGTYTGIEPMGLFWSAIPAPKQKKGLRLIKRVVNTSLDWNIFVIDGSVDVIFIDDIVTGFKNFKKHFTKNQTLHENRNNSDDSYFENHLIKNLNFTDKNRILAHAIAKRYYCYPTEVDSIPIRDGNVRGLVFNRKTVNFNAEKKSSSTKKGVIEIYGGGSFKNHRAALLAQRGFVVFSLAYVDYDDLPSQIIDITVEYLVEAVNFMLSDRFPVIFNTDSGIGLIGLCKGATMLLELAAVNPQKAIRAAIPINAPCFNSIGSFRRLGSRDNIAYQWDINDPLLWRNGDGVISDGQIDWFLSKSEEEKEKFGIPVEKIDAKILFVYGIDDASIGVRNMDYLVGRLNKSGKTNYRCLVYPGTGHILDPPIFPLCRYSYWPLFRDVFLWGGEPKSHHNSQVDSWRQIINFFNTTLV